jgi:tetratricopeptide (TPR) repeat protein
VQAEIGRLRLAKGDNAGARAAFMKAIAKEPGQGTAIEGLVALDLKDQKPADARKRLDAVVAAAPNSADIQVLGARLYAVSFKDNAAAEAAVKRAIAANPNNLEAFDLLARLYFQENNLPAATVEFEKLAQRQPKSVGNQIAIAMLYQLQNKMDQAKTAYERALALDPMAPVAANNLAQLYSDRNENLDQALTLAKAAKAGLPNAHEVDDTIGWLYYKKGLGSLAVPPLKSAVAAQPDNAVYLYHLGAAYALNKNASDARATLQKALAKGAFDGADDARRILDSLK